MGQAGDHTRCSGAELGAEFARKRMGWKMRVTTGFRVYGFRA